MTTLLDAFTEPLTRIQAAAAEIAEHLEALAQAGQGDTVQARLAWLETNHRATGLVAGYEAAMRLAAMQPREQASDILYEKNVGLHVLVNEITYLWNED